MSQAHSMQTSTVSIDGEPRPRRTGAVSNSGTGGGDDIRPTIILTQPTMANVAINHSDQEEMSPPVFGDIDTSDEGKSVLSFCLSLNSVS